MTENHVINTVKEEAIVPPIHDEKANKIIRNYIIAATGGSFVPIPVVSTAVITGIQFFLVRDLCKLYDIPFTSRKINVLVNSALGSVVTQVAAMATKIIPGVSAPTKGLSGAAIAGLYIATLGEFYKVHFQDGGTLEDASIGDLKKYFVEEYKRGDINASSLNPINVVKRIFG
ncbi:YcjF family protein [Flavilitoribacter nigricans]|uniref:GTPase n=1 Tax=Flavilitoribacter nigricans (strain ATCC 23147 / DSM 23189 / NBRC 102662 / NCIMB 1420 / SS-2) TaxID=1122177 RepID=A0A2D0N6F8_FLAN2|nr:DUF697 domain-containing protein [Flavilitoribacter nigricans]PHN04047.1 hypothetical protein CRP01_22885 [Flavilitoribacter nigricans DSM 23189 = NBRC 102662]